MKKLSFFSFLLFNSIVAFTQSVGINTDASLPNASAMLDVKSSTKGMLMPRMLQAQRNLIPSPAAGLMIYQTDNTPGYYYYNGSGWVPLSGAGAVNYWSSNGSSIYNNNTGNVGIGTAVPDEKLTVQTLNNSYGIFHRGEGGNIIGTRMGGTSAGIGTFSNTNMRIFANGNSAMFINSGNSYVGVGIDFPANKLQVGSVGNTGYSGNDFAFGNGTNALRMYQTTSVSLIASSADIVFWPKEKAGNVGINGNFPPGNKLQVGDIGPAGYNGNDIAFGNGSHATAIAQTNTSSQFASTTDFVFLPKYGTGGRVGINTGTPRAPLEVASSVFVTNPSGSSYSYLRSGGDPLIGGSNVNPIPDISIISTGRVLATEFDAYSDARVKNIINISNASKDLETINSLHITDYSMKDIVKHGNRQFKKVIAQDVEKVYPQVVSKHRDFIPNVYQPCKKIIKTADGYLLSFSGNHHLSKQAKKLQILLDEAGMKQFNIISIPSATEVLIEGEAIISDRLFVYGEEVDDFRTVDYEGLTTLNISATQELSKLVKQQQAALEAQNKKIEALTESLKLLKERSCPEHL